MLLIFISSAWFLLACAAQAPPRPPRVEVPQRVTDLTVVQIGRTLEISFTLPSQATDGARLTKRQEIQIFRNMSIGGEAQGSPGRPPVEEAKPWVFRTGEDVPNSSPGQKIVYTSHLSNPEFAQSLGDTFTFMVRTLTRGFRGRPIKSEFSNAVNLKVLDVSGPVEDLRIHPTETVLELRWSPPTRTLSGRALSEIAGYHIYRSRAGQTQKPGSFQLVGESHNAVFLDREFEFGRTYFYTVRAVFREGGQVAESEDSKPYKITPIDLFPPAVPAGVTALYTAGAVDLIWTANLEPDLAGYNVYRREEGKPLQKINEELLPTPIYRDSSVEPGHQYFYRVTARDLSGNESPSSVEVPVETR